MNWYLVAPAKFRKNPYIAYVFADSKDKAIKIYLRYLAKKRFRLADELTEKDCTAKIHKGKIGKKATRIKKESK
jgi:hypothetical protein